MKKFRFSVKKTEYFFLLLSVFVLSCNISDLTMRINNMKQVRRKIPYIFMGYKFSGLKNILGKTEVMGYVTDRSLDDRLSALQFAQAQFILSPVIIDLNNTNHEFILFDCSRPEIANKKIREIGAIALRKNQFGIILARNPKAKHLTEKKR